MYDKKLTLNDSIFKQQVQSLNMPFYYCIFSFTFFKCGTVTSSIEDCCQSCTCFKGHYPDLFFAIRSVLNYTFTIDVSPPKDMLGK